MLFENIAILDENFDFREGQFVGVRDGRIDYMGGAAPADAKSYGRAYKGEGKLLMSALYNAHAHAAMTLLRGYAEDLPLKAWLEQKCWPFEAKLTDEDIYWATLLSCAEMSRYGCVSYSDMYFSTPERVQATIEAGMKANLCEGVIAPEDKPFSEHAKFPLCERYIAEYNNTYDEKIKIDYNIHAEYTCSERACRDIVELAKGHGVRLHIHLSETKSEVEECKGRHAGKSPVQFFEGIGAFDVPMTAAHCVWVDDEDISILAKHGVFVVNNPASNMKLGSGFAPLPKMFSENVNICLGTDGMASNNNANMFSEMYLAALIYKGYSQDPTVVTPKQILRAATRTGALSQGREDCGICRVGARADLCVLDTAGPSWTPMTSAIHNVVFAGDGADCVLTMCDGQVIYENGEWPNIDIEQVKDEVGTRARRIISEL